MKYRKTVLALTLLALAASAATAPLFAQQKGITWLAFSKVNSGMMDEAMRFVHQEDKAFYDGLMADGTIAGWGIATRASHLPDDPNNYVHWVVLPSWEHVDKWVAAAIGVMESQTPEKKAELQEWADKIFASGSHSDVVVEAWNWTGSGEAKPRYVYVGEFFANPGREAAFTELYKSIVPPIGQKLMDEGHLAGFGLHTPSLHTGDGWTHTSYLLLTGLKAVDRYHEEARKALTPEVMQKVVAAHDVARHRDSLWMILHLGGAEGGGPTEAGGSDDGSGE